MEPSTQKVLITVAVLAVAGVGTWLAIRGPGAPAAAPVVAPGLPPPESGRSGDAPRPTGTRRYRPAGPLPAQAIPGGSLAKHEEGSVEQPISRNVGRTLEQMRARLAEGERRETSTFPDLATAERAVGRTLYEQRRRIERWLDEGAKGDQIAIVAKLGEPAGEVLQSGADGPVPGHTVYVILYASDRFPEGFAIRTAYVRTP